MFSIRFQGLLLPATLALYLPRPKRGLSPISLMLVQRGLFSSLAMVDTFLLSIQYLISIKSRSWMVNRLNDLCLVCVFAILVYFNRLVAIIPGT